jgi:HSP20 family molecular chaperone IbpA
MNNKLIQIGLLTGLIGSTLSASNYGIMDRIENIEFPEISFLKKEDILETKKNNLKEIKILETKINKLVDENLKIDKIIKKNPKLYEKKKTVEETKNDYFFRYKLNGANIKNINFKIEHNKIYVNMDLRKEEKTKNNYFFNERTYSEIFTIPNDVKQNKIKHFVDGDYFTIKLPKDK